LLKSRVCGTREQCTNALFIGEKSTTMARKKKKEREKTRKDETQMP